MSNRGILIFAYDGSFEGFLSLVFDSFSMKTVPADIVIFDEDVNICHTIIGGEVFYGKQ